VLLEKCRRAIRKSVSFSISACPGRQLFLNGRFFLNTPPSSPHTNELSGKEKCQNRSEISTKSWLVSEISSRNCLLHRLGRYERLICTITKDNWTKLTKVESTAILLTRKEILLSSMCKEYECQAKVLYWHH
jgi:hypothetical protein